MFKVMAPYQPAPPPSSPFDWGDEGRVRELLGETFELELEEGASTLRTPSAEAYWELFSTSYGPTKTLAESLGERREDLHRDWVEFFASTARARDAPLNEPATTSIHRHVRLAGQGRARDRLRRVAEMDA
jgi:hypothetical protein